MTRFLAHSWVLLIGLAWLGQSNQAHAWGSGVKVSNFRVNFNVEVQSTPRVPPPTAPWYAYFPADPRIMGSMQTSPYPAWPQQFPPPAPMPAPQKSAVPTGSGPMLTQQWPSYAYGSNLQPVGYVPQTPSYWYQGR